MTAARGLDVTGLYQHPDQMRYDDWRALGFCYGFYEVAIGLRVMPHLHRHRSLMRAAGYLTGPYQALHEDVPPVAQCRLLLSLRGPDDELPNLLDFERPGLTEAMLRAYCDEYDATTDRELWIYTGLGVWNKLVPPPARPRYAKYGLLIAAYPFDAPSDRPQPMDARSVALRSNPPERIWPVIPGPWPEEDAWQHTGHGRLPGYDKDLDLQVYPGTEAELRARFAQPDLATEILASVDVILGEVAGLRARAGAG